LPRNPVRIPVALFARPALPAGRFGFFWRQPEGGVIEEILLFIAAGSMLIGALLDLIDRRLSRALA